MKKFIIMAAALVWGAQAFAYQFASDIPKKVVDQMKDDLTFMTTLKGDQASQLHQQIFGQIDGATYQKFFESRVTEIGYNGCGSGNAVACVIPFYAPNKMWITDNYIKFSHPQISRLMVIYHEARHTESDNGNWGHARCPTPFLDANGKEIKSIWTGATLAGEPACDVTPLGSYGSSMILLKNISKFCTNCSDKVKMDAGIYADDQFKRVIDEKAKADIKRDLY